MYWGHLRRVGSHVKSSLWTVPLLAIPVAMIATRLVHWLDAQREWTLLGLGVAGAQAMLQAATTATLSFLVFTFGSLLVAIQVASGQMTPRIIATTLLRDNVFRYTVCLFMLTFMFVQGVYWQLDRQVAAAAADRASEAVAMYGSSAGAAQAVAVVQMESAGIRDVSVSVSRGSDLTTVTVSGTSPGIIAGTSAHVSARSVTPSEGVRERER